MKENGVTQFIDKSLAAEGLSRPDFFADYIRPAIKNKTTWKVVDKDTNTMVSVAQWIFQYDTSEPTEKTTIGENKTPPSENMRRVMNMLFAASQEFARTHYLGRPHASMEISEVERESQSDTGHSIGISSNTSGISKTWGSEYASGARYTSGRRSWAGLFPTWLSSRA